MMWIPPKSLGTQLGCVEPPKKVLGILGFFGTTLSANIELQAGSFEDMNFNKS